MEAKNEQQFNWNLVNWGRDRPMGRGDSIAGPPSAFHSLSLASLSLGASSSSSSSLSLPLFLLSPSPPPSNFLFPLLLPPTPTVFLSLSLLALTCQASRNFPLEPETRTEVFVQSRQASLPSTFESLCVFVCFAALQTTTSRHAFNLPTVISYTLSTLDLSFRLRYLYPPVVKFPFSLPAGTLPKTIRAIFLLPCYTLPKWRGTFLFFYH